MDIGDVTPTEGDFISEPIVPEAGSFATGPMTRGLAALPAAFVWRGRRYAIVECLEQTKQSAPEGHRAGNERYLRRQWFVVRLDNDAVARIYFERQARPGASARSAKNRWFLYTISSGAETADHAE